MHSGTILISQKWSVIDFNNWETALSGTRSWNRDRPIIECRLYRQKLKEHEFGVQVANSSAAFPAALWATKARQIALRDYLTRSFAAALNKAGPLLPYSCSNLTPPVYRAVERVQAQIISTPVPIDMPKSSLQFSRSRFRVPFVAAEVVASFGKERWPFASSSTHEDREPKSLGFPESLY